VTRESVTEKNASNVPRNLQEARNKQHATNAKKRSKKVSQQTTEIDMGTFNDLCRQAWEQRTKVDEMARLQAIESKILEEMKAKVLAYLEHYELEKQHVPGFGTLSVQNRFTVTVPKGDNKLTFFDYLKENGIFEDMATVHSQTLNSWFKEKQEQALAEGNLEFSVPGISEAKIMKTLGFRKG